jgi:hypothetical protein
MRSVYTAYATLPDGTPERHDFESLKWAVVYARHTANEGGACFVVRDKEEVVFNTHATLEDALLHGTEILLPKTINVV